VALLWKGKPINAAAIQNGLYIGLMSGTSLDGVDAVLARFQPQPVLLASAYLPYPDSLRQALLALQAPGDDELARAALISQDLAKIYAKTIKRLLQQHPVAPEQIAAVGCHGQTVRHQPQHGYTLQLNAPARLAELTQLTVIADFRSRDIAAGGQGAPLVPAFHQALLQHPSRPRAVLNIGGIANLTDLPAANSPNPEAILGFDTGPGNILLDAWIERHCQQTFDANGEWASQGQLLPDLLQRLLAHPFFALPPPKSCGRDEFNLNWLLEQLQQDAFAPADVQATLLELTAITIADAVQRHGQSNQLSELILCGGGAHNAQLVNRLRAHLPGLAVFPTDQLGVPGDWLEAYAFAWLAYRCLNRLPGNLVAVTGARGPRILGAIYPA
jgi:anhydro-N-acetylmuramic acid kinase